MDYRQYTKRNLRRGVFSKWFNFLSLTNWLIILNILIFIIASIFMGFIGEEKFSILFSLQANEFFSGKYWTVFTSMFLHANIGHLLANMVSLFFIGNFVEKLIGRKRFFWFYILSGIFAGIFYAVLSYYLGSDLPRIFVSPDVFAVGASGAIFALLGLLALLTPFNKVYLIAGPIIAIILESVLSNVSGIESFMNVLSLLISAYVIFSIFAIFSFNKKIMRLAIPLEMPFWLLPFIAIVPLVIVGLFVELPIGNTAHLGGLIGGLAYALYLKKKYKRKTKMIRNYFRG